jgi:hydroxyethylthiazole kinase-like uncharacterized protein yjeF
MQSNSNAINIEHLDRSSIKGFITPFPSNIHKGDRGGVLIAGGSFNYRGAPLLAALGALRAGAGLAVLAIPDFMTDLASIFLPEAIFIPLKTRLGVISPEDVPAVLEPWGKRCSAAVFGPGIGRDPAMGKLTEWFLNKWSGKLLFDADALFFFSRLKGTFRDDLIITPHAGEAATVLGCDLSRVNNNRIKSAHALAHYSGTALLKGMKTVVVSGDKARVVCEGSNALAVPGSGDVLSGVIGAFAARGLSPFDAASAGALIHAVAGSYLEDESGSDGNLAREIADAIPKAIR